MYQIYTYNDNNDVVVINEYDDLLEAYKNINTECQIYNFREYYLSLFNEVENVTEFTTTYYNKIKQIIESLYNSDFKIDDIIVLFINSEQEIPYFILNSKQYVFDLNTILEDELDSKTFIRINPNNILTDIREFFKNHTQEFLNIVNILIEHDLYNHFPWKKKGNIIIETDPTIEIRYNKLYNDKDVYNEIRFDEIYSASEYDVLQDFMTDFEHVTQIFFDNIETVINYMQLSSELKSIIRYI